MKENNLLFKKKKHNKNIESVIESVYLGDKLGINIIKDIEISRPYQIIRTDTSEIITKSGKYQLAVFLDDFTKKVLSWHIDHTFNAEIAVNTLNPILPLLNSDTYIHQDQGSVNTSIRYVTELIEHNLFVSYSEIATPTDNAPMESFFGRFKVENKKDLFEAQSLEQIRGMIGNIIKYYNNERIHTAIDGTPQEFLETFLLKSVQC